MNLQQILETFTIERDGRVIAVPCGYIVLGFKDFEACRLPLIEVFDKMCARMGEHVRHYVTHSMRQYKRVDKTFESLFRGWFGDPYRVPDGGGEYGLEAHSGDDPQATGSWGVKFNVEPWSLDFEAGTLAFEVPLELAFDGGLEAIAREIAETLPLRSACAGLSLARNGRYPTLHDKEMAAWNMRYHGLLPNSPIGARYALHEGALTPAWITMLDAELSAACGPTARLGDDVTAETIGELTFLRAGDAPTLADAHADRSEVAPYQALHRFLDPVVFSEAEHLYFEGFDDEMLERWISRFEDA